MRVSDLALNNFRSYRELVLNFPQGTAVFQGPNGQGKTNLVEAIAYLSTFSSPRVSADRALVRRPISAEDPVNAAVIRAKVTTASRDYLLELELVRGNANRARLNGMQVQPRELLGILRTVVFAPEDLQLLRGEPALRRYFIDEVITEIYPVYSATKAEFEKILRQRAAVLKQLRAYNSAGWGGKEMLAVWDEQLAKTSAQIAVLRMVFCRELGERLHRLYSQVSSENRQANLAYKASPAGLCEKLAAVSAELAIESGILVGDFQAAYDQIEAAYLEELAANSEAEIERGANLVGAHRDDLSFTLDDLPVKGYASHGETWSVALGIRMAEADLLTYDGDTPVLVLDDVFAELDARRRVAVTKMLGQFEQILITAAVPEDVPADLEATGLPVSKDEQGISTVQAEFGNPDPGDISD